MSVSKDPLLFEKVRNDLMDKIQRNIYKPGTFIPTEGQLSKHYGVSRITIRRAISDLVAEGHLIKQQGVGTYVSQKKLLYHVNLITSWTDSIISQGGSPSSQIIQFCQEHPTAEDARLLKMNVNDYVYRLERVRYCDGVPISICTDILPEKRVKGLINEGLIGESLYHTLRVRYNLTFKSAAEQTEAVLAKDRESELLRIKKNSPMLFVRRISYDSDNNPAELVYAYYRGDKYTFETKFIGADELIINN